MIISHLTAKFLNYLYGPMAGFYDIVSNVVSFGRWKKWIFAIEPFIQGKMVLEVGFGPGHLLKLLSSHNFSVYGIDISHQMSRLAYQRLIGKSRVNPTIIRGTAQTLPVQSGGMDTIIATFPSDYIFNTKTLNEIKRVLKPDGTLLILLAAFPRTDSIPARLLAFLYKATGEIPASRSVLEEQLHEQMLKAGMHASIHWIHEKFSDLMLIVVN
jgi:ubiquinone/menaquinone biosynthesis C-methylase UbiE